MYCSVILLTAFLGITFADDFWNSFDDFDTDDYMYRGYRPAGFLRGGRQLSTRYPTTSKYNTGNRWQISNLGSGGSRMSSYGGKSYSTNGGYKGIGKSNGYSSSYNNGLTTSGYLGFASVQPSFSSRRISTYRPSTRSLATSPRSVQTSLSLRFRDDDDDDFDDGFLGPAVVRPNNGINSGHHNIKTHKRTISISRPTVNVQRGILGAASGARQTARTRPAIRPIDKTTYNRKITSVGPRENVGTTTIQLPLRTFDNDENDFDDGVLGRAVRGLPLVNDRPNFQRGVLGSANVRPSGIAQAAIRPISNTIYNRKITSARPSTNNLDQAPIQLPVTSFDDADDDFDGRVLGPAVVRPSNGGAPLVRQRPTTNQYGTQNISPLGQRGNLGVVRLDDRPSGNLGFSRLDDRPSGNLGFSRLDDRPSGNLGFSRLDDRPSFENDEDDFNRGILGAAIRGAPSSGRTISTRTSLSQQSNTYNGQTSYQPSYNNNDFGSSPVFSTQQSNSGYLGYNSQYPMYGNYHYGSGNSYANGYGGLGGYANGNWYGGGLGVGGFVGRFRNGGGSGGGGWGGAGGDSDDGDFDDDNEGGSGGSGGFNVGAGFGGGGVAGRFVGGGFGSIGGIKAYNGGNDRHGTYPKRYSKRSY